MSSPHIRTTPGPVRQRAACMCATGGRCTSYAPGHALHLIQSRLARATPTGWTDALVESSDPGSGEVVVRTLDAGTTIRLWSGAGAADTVTTGDPVAVHRRYDVLSVGPAMFNCIAG